MEVLEREYQRRRSSAVSRSDIFLNECYSGVVLSIWEDCIDYFRETRTKGTFA